MPWWPPSPTWPSRWPVAGSGSTPPVECLRTTDSPSPGTQPPRVVGMDADVVVVGAGLSGLVAAAELADAGRRVVVVEQESEANLGGQAHWSFGGLFLVD